MIPKKNRLTGVEVRKVMKEGRTLRLTNIVVKYSSAARSGVAVAVSKKVARNAVERNKIRRAIYGALPHQLPSKVHAVFLVQKKVSDYMSDINTACSKLFS